MANVPIGAGLDGGVNLFDAPNDIQDNEMVYSKNLYPRSPGRLAMRPSSSLIALLGGTDGYPIHLHFLPINSPAAFVLFSRALSRNNSSDTTKMIAYNSISATNLAVGDFGKVTQYRPASLAYNGLLYGFGGYGTNAAGKVLRYVPGGGGAIEIVDFNYLRAGNEALRPAVVGMYRDRTFFANFGPGFESTALFSDPYAPHFITANALATNGGYFLTNPDDGDRIVAGVELLQTGQAAVQSSFVVLKEFSAYLITGEPVFSDGSGTDTLTVSRLPVNAGCASPNTVVTTPFGVIWAGPDDVWVFPEGQLPYRIGTKIRPILQASPANVRYLWHAVLHDGFYKLALFSEGQGPSDDSPCGEQWWLDLRTGPPQTWREAKWYGPQIYTYQITDSGPPDPDYTLGTRCMALDITPGANRALYSAEALTYAPSGYIHLVGYGAHGTHDAAYDYSGASGLEKAYQTRAAVETELVTKEFRTLMSGNQMVADPLVEKGFRGAELDIRISAAGQLGWNWILNSGRTVGAERDVDIVPASGFVLGVDVLDTGTFSDETNRVALDPAPLRIVGSAIQLDLFNKPGYYIYDANDLCVIEVEVAPSVFTQFSFSLTHGLYADISTLVAYLTGLFNAALAPFAITVTGTFVGGLIRFTRSGAGEIDFGTSHCPLASKSKVRALAHLLGFTNWDNDYEGGTSITATEAVYTVNVPSWDFQSGMVLHFYTIPRRLL